MTWQGPKDATIAITGAGGMVGKALCAQLKRQGFTNVVGLTRQDVDLLDYAATVEAFQALKPQVVFHLAAAVYGIWGNMTQQGHSFLSNTLMNTYVVEACRQAGVAKVVAMGSGAMYPYPSPSLPLAPDMVWAGAPHGSERAYGHAKRHMLAQLEAYHDSYDMAYALVISGNLYGPHDTFDTKNGHVVPSLVRKCAKAAEHGGSVEVWGDGSAQRDFLYIDDVARALEVIMHHGDGAINMGSGQVHAIRDVVAQLARIAGVDDRVVWDPSMPNGQDFRAYDLTPLFDAGFEPSVTMEEGLARTYAWYVAHRDTARHGAAPRG